jgi:hypothetical protein
MVTLRHSIVVRKDIQINCLKIHVAFRAFTSFRGSRDGIVGIATRYRLEGVGIESRWGPRFSAPIQTGSEAHPASCKMSTESFPGVKAAGAWC